MSVWDRFKLWYQQPFNQDMDATSWLLFVVLISAGIIFWRYILKHVEGSL